MKIFWKNPDKQPILDKDWQENRQTVKFTLPHMQTNALSMTKMFHYVHEINKAEQMQKDRPAQALCHGTETLAE